MKSSINNKWSFTAIRSALTSTLALAATTALLVTGLSVVSASAGAALKVAHATAVCNTTVSAGTGTVVGPLIVGVTAGTTKITLDCNDATNAAIVAQASLLSAIGTTAVSQSGEADTGAFGAFNASATDTGCPAATAGMCTVAIYSVPATFASADAKGVCPPSQTQINAGLFACALAAATAGGVPVTGAEYVMTFASQTTVPNAPSIAATPATGVAGGSVKVSDATANTGYWWANAVQAYQAAALSTTAAAPPTTCAASGGYGNVPAAFLEVNWFASGSTTAIPGSAAGVTISNDCYDGSTLHAPVLSGSIPVPATLKVGTSYKAYLCELNLTPYPSNDTNATTYCGPAPGGESWIDASFAFTDALGPITQVAPTSGTTPPNTATSVQLNVTGSSGSVTFVTSSTAVAGLTVTSGGLLSSSASLVDGIYTISGTDSDTTGDSGTWTYTLSVGTAQAALTITTLSGRAGNALSLATSGGSSSGAVTYTATNGTATGCSVTANSLSATGAGTCLVVATKAADSTYLAVSSASTTVTFTGAPKEKLVSRVAVLGPNARLLSIRISCANAACNGTLSVTVSGQRIHRPFNLGSAAYHVGRGSSKSVVIRLTTASRIFLAGNPGRPLIGSVYVTDNLGKKHTYIGRVSLLK
jgi:hypothetical protein